MALRYPRGVGVEGQDYVTFTPMEYRSNGSDPGSSNNQIPGGGERGGGGQSHFEPYRGGANGRMPGAPSDLDAQQVVLYMPNSAPSIGNGNDWQSSGMQFNGHAGAFAKDLGSRLTNTVITATEGGFNPKAALDNIGTFLGNQINNTPGIIAQKGMETVAGKLGTSANALMSVSRGIIFNPNVELLYKSPMFRTFGFNFEFVPQDPDEAQIINSIIRNFKMWSAPSNEGAYFELPYVWQVNYMSGAGINKNLNAFKRAALKNVQVQSNPQTDMHVAHAGGVPISTSISLEFMEVDVITRQDHNRIGGQGY